MQTIKSKLRRRDGSVADITAKVVGTSKPSQAERDAEVAKKFEARMAKTAPKAETSGGK